MVNFRTKRAALAVAISSVLALAGCNSDDDSSSGNDSTGGNTTLTGQFYDAPTNGLYYVTSSGIEGYTKVDGQPGTFQYKEGDTVEFRLGGPEGLLLGRGTAQEFVMPQDIASPEVAINTARLLLSIDENKDPKSDVATISVPQAFTEDAPELAAIDLGKFSVVDVKNIINGVSPGTIPEDNSLVGQDSAEIHLTKTSNTVFTERTGDDEMVNSFDQNGKIIRQDIIKLKAGSKLCYLDLTVENEGQPIGQTTVEYGVINDKGEEGVTTFAGSNDHFGSWNGSVDACHLNTAEGSTVDEFELSNPEDAIIKANELSSIYRNQNRVDVEEDDNGNIVITGDKYTHADGVYETATKDSSIQDQRNVYQFDAESQTIFDLQTRNDKNDDEGGQLVDRKGRLVGSEGAGDAYAWVYNSKSPGSEILSISYEVDSKDTASPLVDLMGDWVVENTRTGCSNVAIATYTFGKNTLTVHGEEFSSENRDDLCTTKPFTDKPLEYSTLAKTDFWFLAVNNGPKATIAQLNTRIKWDDSDEGAENTNYAYARWSYRPNGGVSQGIIYRYKEDFDTGKIEYTDVYRRK